MFKFQNAYKLLTREDALSVHKILAVVCVAHYAYRFYNFLMFNDLLFERDWLTAGALVAHTLLSCSSLVFKISGVRNRRGPMVYPEFRAHSIVFALRSIAVMALIMLDLKMLRPLAVVATMLAADRITEHYALSEPKSKTMRDMPYPDDLPLPVQKAITYYYNVSQIGATLSLLMRDSVDYAFLILYPIQIAAFLMTCVRKSIITAGAWHALYAIALGLVYVYTISHEGTVGSSGGGRFSTIMASVCVSRFVFRVNKYAIWAMVLLVL